MAATLNKANGQQTQPEKKELSNAPAHLAADKGPHPRKQPEENLQDKGENAAFLVVVALGIVVFGPGNVVGIAVTVAVQRIVHTVGERTAAVGRALKVWIGAIVHWPSRYHRGQTEAQKQGNTTQGRHVEQVGGLSAAL